MVIGTKYVYIKSTTVYIPSSELGLSQPLSRQRECPSPQNRGGGVHSPAGEGLGESQFRRLVKSLVLCLLCGNWLQEKLQHTCRKQKRLPQEYAQGHRHNNLIIKQGQSLIIETSGQTWIWLYCTALRTRLAADTYTYNSGIFPTLYCRGFLPPILHKLT